jgi:hypothetical protein
MEQVEWIALACHNFCKLRKNSARPELTDMGRSAQATIPPVAYAPLSVTGISVTVTLIAKKTTQLCI